MRTYLIAGFAALSLIATPALAKDPSPTIPLNQTHRDLLLANADTINQGFTFMGAYCSAFKTMVKPHERALQAQMLTDMAYTAFRNPYLAASVGSMSDYLKVSSALARCRRAFPDRTIEVSSADPPF
jgi:hypothetical protein